MKLDLNMAAVYLGALIFGGGLVQLFGWPVLLLLAGALLVVWGGVTQ